MGSIFDLDVAIKSKGPTAPTAPKQKAQGSKSADKPKDPAKLDGTGVLFYTLKATTVDISKLPGSENRRSEIKKALLDKGFIDKNGLKLKAPDENFDIGIDDLTPEEKIAILDVLQQVQTYDPVNNSGVQVEGVSFVDIRFSGDKNKGAALSDRLQNYPIDQLPEDLKQELFQMAQLLHETFNKQGGLYLPCSPEEAFSDPQKLVMAINSFYKDYMGDEKPSVELIAQNLLVKKLTVETVKEQRKEVASYQSMLSEHRRFADEIPVDPMAEFNDGSKKNDEMEVVKKNISTKQAEVEREILKLEVFNEYLGIKSNDEEVSISGDVSLVYINKKFSAKLKEVHDSEGNTMRRSARQNVFSASDVEIVHTMEEINKNPQRMADANPFVPLIMKIMDVETANRTNPSGKPKAIGENLTKDHLVLLKNYLCGEGQYVNAYFHRPLDEEERALLKELQKKYGESTAEGKLIGRLLNISFDPANPDLDKVSFTEEEAAVFDGLIAVEDVDGKPYKLLADLKRSYRKDVEFSKSDATAVQGLIDWMTEKGYDTLTPDLDLMGNRPAEEIDERYAAGMRIVAREVFSSRIGFQPRNEKTERDSLIGRLLIGTAEESYQQLVSGGKPTMVTTGISAVETWKMVCLKTMYLKERMSTHGDESELSALNDLQAKLQANVLKLKTKIDQLKADKKKNDKEKEKELLPLLKEYYYLKGRLDDLYGRVMGLDRDFFEWIVPRFAKEAGKLSEWIEKFNEKELGSIIKDPFTGEIIHLSEVPAILTDALKDKDVRASLENGWLSVDPSKIDYTPDPSLSTEDQDAVLNKIRRVKMALAILIQYMDMNENNELGINLDIPILGEIGVNPATAHFAMSLRGMFTGEGQAARFGAMVKADLLTIFKDDPIARSTILRKMETPDLFDVEMLDIFIKAIELLSPDGKKDKEIERLNSFREEIKTAPICAKSGNLDTLAAQEIVQAYVYMGKLFSGEKKGGASGAAKSGDSEENKGMWSRLNRMALGIGEFASESVGMITDPDFITGGLWGQITAQGGYAPGESADRYGTTGQEALESLGVDGIPAYVGGGLLDVGLQFGYTLFRFGIYMGFMFGVQLPWSVVSTGFGGNGIKMDMQGNPILDDEGRLIFNEGKSIGDKAEDVAKAGLQLATQLFMFRNNPFLLYGWLGIGEDLEGIFASGGDWGQDKKYRILSAVIKFWVANFYLLSPGENGMWDSTLGRLPTIDRYLWKYLFEGVKAVADLARELGIPDKDLGELFRGTPLERQASMVKEYGTWDELVEIMTRKAPEKGALGAFSEFVGSRSAYQEFVLNVTKNRLMESKAGKVGKAGLSIIKSLLTNPVGGIYEFVKNHSGENMVAYVFAKAIDLTFRLPNQTLNLSYHLWSEWAGSGKAWTYGQLPGETPLQPAAVMPFGITRLGTSRPFDVSRNDVAPSIPQALHNPALSQVVIDVKNDGSISDHRYQSLQAVTQSNGSARRIDFTIKRGETRTEIVSLPVTAVYVNSVVAMYSENAVTVIPMTMEGTSLDSSDYARAEIHINLARLVEEAGVSQEDLATLSNLELSGMIQRLLPQCANKLAELVKAQEKRYEKEPIDNPRYRIKERPLDMEGLSRFLQKEGIALVLTEEEKKNPTPFTDETAMGLVKELKNEGITTLTTSQLSTHYITAMRENYKPQADPTQSDIYVFELCGNDALGNFKEPILKEMDYRIDTSAPVGKKVSLTLEGEQAIDSYLAAQSETTPEMRDQVIEKTKKYLELQQYSREVEARQAELRAECSDNDIKGFEQKVKSMWAGQRDRVEGGAIYCEVLRRQLGIDLTPSQKMAGYLGSWATKEQPVFVDLGTGEGKTFALAMDAYLSLLEGKTLILASSQCDAYAQDNYKDTEKILKFLGVEEVVFLDKKEKSQTIKERLFKNDGIRRVVFLGFDTPRFEELFSIYPDMQGRPVYIPGPFMKAIIDESDHGAFDLRHNPAIVSSGSDEKAGDSKEVRLAEELVKNWFTKDGKLTESAKRAGYIENETSEEGAVLTDEGRQYIEAQLARKGLTNSEYFMYRVRAAVHAHLFAVEGTHFVVRGKWLIWVTQRFRKYAYRDKPTGREDNDMQFDLQMHKAIQAMIGAKITDPGLSLASIDVIDHLKGITHSGYSGTEAPLQLIRQREGALALSIDSAFMRARVDYQGIVYSDRAEQKRNVADLAIEDVLSGRASLIHAAVREGDKKEGAAEADGRVLSIEEINREIKSGLETRGYKIASQSDLPRKYREYGFVAEKNGQKIFVRMLVDTGDFKFEQRMAKEIGCAGYITITDIANRAMNPGIKDAKTSGLSEAIEAMADSTVEIRSIVTEWKNSVRHFIQEVNRVGRPNPSKASRAPAVMRGVYWSGDPNFDTNIKTFLDYEIKQNGGKPVVILPSEFPKEVTPESAKKYAQNQIINLERKREISTNQRELLMARVETAADVEEIKNIILNAWVVSEDLDATKSFGDILNELQLDALKETALKYVSYLEGSGLLAKGGKEAKAKAQELRTAINQAENSGNVLAVVRSAAGGGSASPLLTVEDIRRYALDQIEYLEKGGVLTTEKASQIKSAIQQANNTEEIKTAIASAEGDITVVVKDYWRVIDERANAENAERKQESSFGKDINDAMEALNELDKNIGTEHLTAILGKAYKSTIEMFMHDCGLFDPAIEANDAMRKERIKLFITRVKKHFGISLEIDSNLPIEDIKKAIDFSIEQMLAKAKVSGHTKERFLKKLRGRIKELKVEMEMINRQLREVPYSQHNASWMEAYLRYKLNLALVECDHPRGLYLEVAQDPATSLGRSRGRSNLIFRMTTASALGFSKKITIDDAIATQAKRAEEVKAATEAAPTPELTPGDRPKLVFSYDGVTLEAPLAEILSNNDGGPKVISEGGREFEYRFSEDGLMVREAKVREGSESGGLTLGVRETGDWKSVPAQLENFSMRTMLDKMGIITNIPDSAFAAIDYTVQVNLIRKLSDTNIKTVYVQEEIFEDARRLEGVLGEQLQELEIGEKDNYLEIVSAREATNGACNLIIGFDPVLELERMHGITVDLNGHEGIDFAHTNKDLSIAFVDKVKELNLAKVVISKDITTYKQLEAAMKMFLNMREKTEGANVLVLKVENNEGEIEGIAELRVDASVQKGFSIAEELGKLGIKAFVGPDTFAGIDAETQRAFVERISLLKQSLGLKEVAFDSEVRFNSNEGRAFLSGFIASDAHEMAQPLRDQFVRGIFNALAFVSCNPTNPQAITAIYDPIIGMEEVSLEIQANPRSFSGLSPKEAKEFTDKVKEIQAARGITRVIVDNEVVFGGKDRNLFDKFMAREISTFTGRETLWFGYQAGKTEGVVGLIDLSTFTPAAPSDPRVQDALRNAGIGTVVDAGDRFQQNRISPQTPRPAEPLAPVAPAPGSNGEIKFTGESFAQALNGKEGIAVKQLELKGVTCVHVAKGTGSITLKEFVQLAPEILPLEESTSGQFIVFFRDGGQLKKEGLFLYEEGTHVEVSNDTSYRVLNANGNDVGSWNLVDGHLQYEGGCESFQALTEKVGRKEAEAIVKVRDGLLKINGAGKVEPSEAAAKITTSPEPRKIDAQIIDSNIKTRKELIEAIQKVSGDDTYIEYRSSSPDEVFAISGKASDFKAWLENNDPMALRRLAESAAKAFGGKLPADFFIGFISARKEAVRADIAARQTQETNLKVSLPLVVLRGTKAELLQELTTLIFSFKVEGGTGEILQLHIYTKDAIDLLSPDPSIRKAAKNRITEQCKNNGLTTGDTQKALEILQSQVEAANTSINLEAFIGDKLVELGAKVRQNEMRKLKKQLEAAPSDREKMRIALEIEAKVAEAVRAHKLAFALSADVYIKEHRTLNLGLPELNEIWKVAESEQLLRDGKFREYFEKGASGAGLALKVGAVSYKTIKDGLMGLAVDGILNGVSEIFSDDPSLLRWAEKTGEGALGWAKFGLTTGALEHFVGLSSSMAMAGAMILPAMRDLSEAQYGDKGKILFSHAMSSGGFVGGMAAANRFLKSTTLGSSFAARFPKIGGMLGLFAGMGGAWVFGQASNYLYENTEWYSDLVDSEPVKAIGSGLGNAYNLSLYSLEVGIAAGALNLTAKTLSSVTVKSGFAWLAQRFGALGLSSVSTILSRLNPILLTTQVAVWVGSSLMAYLQGSYEESVTQRVRMELEAQGYEAAGIYGDTEELMGLLPSKGLGIAWGQIKVGERIDVRYNSNDPMGDPMTNPSSYVEIAVPEFLSERSVCEYALNYMKQNKIGSIYVDVVDESEFDSFGGMKKEIWQALLEQGLIEQDGTVAPIIWKNKKEEAVVDPQFSVSLESFDIGLDLTNQEKERILGILKSHYDVRLVRAVLAKFEKLQYSQYKTIVLPKLEKLDALDKSKSKQFDSQIVLDIEADIRQKDAELSSQMRHGIAGVFLPKLGEKNPQELIHGYLSHIEWGEVSIYDIASRGTSVQYATFQKKVGEKKIAEYALAYAEQKGVNYTNRKVILEVVKRFGLNDISDYIKLFPKIERMLIQQQIAKLHLLAPGGTNKDIRTMFNKKGELIAGQEEAFVAWVSRDKIARNQYLEERSSELVSASLDIERMFDLIKIEQNGGLLEPTESDKRRKLVVQDKTTGAWAVNTKNSYYKKYVEAGCKPENENIHLVLVKFIIPQDINMELIDAKGYLNMDIPQVNKFFASIYESIKQQAQKHAGEIEAKAKESIQKAKAGVDKWARQYTDCQEQYNALLSVGQLDVAKLSELNEYIEEIAQNWQKAMGELEVANKTAGRSLRLLILKLQKQWYESKDPLQKAIFAAQIEGYGGSASVVTEGYYKNICRILNVLEGDPQKNADMYIQSIKDLDILQTV